MNYFLCFKRSFWLTTKNGDLRLYKHIGPFASGADAKAWLIRYRSVLDAADAGDVLLDTLDDPNDL